MFYKSDFDLLLLSTHLQIFSQTYKPDGEVSITDLYLFQGCTPGQLDLMSQVSKLVRLLLVMPATNAESACNLALCDISRLIYIPP